MMEKKITVYRGRLTELQEILILEHIRIGKRLNLNYAIEDCAWAIETGETEMICWGWSNSLFPMDRYLGKIGIPESAILPGGE
jgi:hypothetical protein